MTERTRHVPVLLQTAIRMLNVRSGGVVVDATLGYAGHASEIARRLGPEGTLIGFDRDPEALRLARERLDALRTELGAAMPRVILHDVEFSRAKEALAGDGLLGRVDGLLADFGVSSMQLDEAHRGFSFQAEGPLDMRMNPREGETAEQVVNHMGEKELANVIYEFGEERRSRRIARAIVRSRPVTTTAQLARIVAGAAGSMKGEKIHPATRTFQALRIYVNAELSEIEALLESAPEVLKPGGRLVAISFHSLEDRRVKDALREGAQRGIWEVLTRKPMTAEAEEQGLDRNPRARSAKLRAAETKSAVSC
ncbi:MAG: 16S rRNA (cytosine(1402)-N(4))-methyltransferase RsmH [Acidobacteriaceae bacterium]